jgi:hypothetical protein
MAEGQEMLLTLQESYLNQRTRLVYRYLHCLRVTMAQEYVFSGYNANVACCVTPCSLVLRCGSAEAVSRHGILPRGVLCELSLGCQIRGVIIARTAN